MDENDPESIDGIVKDEGGESKRRKKIGSLVDYEMYPCLGLSKRQDQFQSTLEPSHASIVASRTGRRSPLDSLPR